MSVSSKTLPNQAVQKPVGASTPREITRGLTVVESLETPNRHALFLTGCVHITGRDFSGHILPSYWHSSQSFQATSASSRDSCIIGSCSSDFVASSIQAMSSDITPSPQACFHDEVHDCLRVFSLKDSEPAVREKPQPALRINSSSRIAAF